MPSPPYGPPDRISRLNPIFLIAPMRRSPFLLPALGLAAAFLTTGCVSPTTPVPVPATIRVMSYNIHHGRGMDGHVDLQRIAYVILQENPDLVALQEVDRGVERTDRMDMPAELAALTGMTSIFSNNFHFQGGEYGNAILSRHPVISSHNTHYRMVRSGEQRGLLHVVVEIHGQRLRFLNTHLDYRPDDTERLSNIEEILDLLALHTAWPTVVAGDFNDLPGSRTHQIMTRHLIDAWESVGPDEGFTIPSDAPNRRIDYVFYHPVHGPTPRLAWVPNSTASDHLPLVVEFELVPAICGKE
jgi:endonuclease/exonuclease/phosphatase family metal-dependent hydrolase